MSSNDENPKSIFHNEYFIGAFSIFVLLYLFRTFVAPLLGFKN